MRARATSMRVTGGGAQLSPVAKMVSALRRLGGMLIYAPDNALGDGAPNLLSAPEDFSDAAWTKASATITPNSAAAPDGTNSAQLFYPTSTGTFRVVRRASGVGNPWSGANTFTIHAKAAGLTRIGFLNAVGNNAGASVNLTTGAVTIVDSSLTVSVEALPDGWYRCKVTAAAGWVYAYLTDTDTGITVTASGTSGIYIWGAKLEQGSTATAYTPQSVLRQRGSFTDSAGTTPVTAVGDLFGLLLDRCGTVGGERKQSFVTGVGGTAPAATYDPTTGVGSVTRVDLSNQSFVRITGLTSAASYRLSIANTGAVVLNVRQLDYAGSTIATIAAGASWSGFFTGHANCVITAAGGTATFTLNEFRELTGNHATQSAVASKPSVQRVPKRLGLELIASQDLTTWVSGGAFASWNGSTSTATTITTTGTNGGRYVRMPCVPGKSYTFAALVAAGTANGAVAIAYGTSGNTLISEQTGWFVASGVARLTTVAPANAAFMEFVVRGGATGQTATFTSLTAGEVLEWATVISFDGSNDFLQTGITTGNEGFVAVGVRHNTAVTCYPLAAGGLIDSMAGMNLRLINGVTPQLLVCDGTLRQVLQADANVTLGTPFVYSGGWNSTDLLVGVDATEKVAARTRNPTAAVTTTIGAADGTGAGVVNGPLYAACRAPVYPDAATRKVIINGLAALQGRTL